MYAAARITPVADRKATKVLLLYTDNKVKYSPIKPDVPGKPIAPKVKIRKNRKINSRSI